MTRFSRRTAWVESPSKLHAALARMRTEGRALVDLANSNPTRAGLLHSSQVLARLLDRDMALYEPHALGSSLARQAVVDYYARRDVSATVDRVWLCAGTSEAYAHLFAILCDPGDAVLVPRPGYPLLEILGDVTGVRRIPYPLAYDGFWHVDAAGLHDALGSDPRIRAVVVVSPNNPTGNYLSAEDLARLEAACVEHDIALIVDSVFADYPHDPLDTRSAHVQVHDCPCFVLSGLSKVAALPQMKLSWVVVQGPDAPAMEATRRAEQLADAFLSVAGPVQRALPDLLEAAEPMQTRIRARLRRNLAHLRRRTRSEPVSLLHSEGGWTALLRLPQIGERDDDAWAVDLLEHAGLLVQPGRWFDLPAPPRVALSLLTPPEVLADGLDRLLDYVARQR
jgi:alanine-synthesizing transaminase